MTKNTPNWEFRELTCHDPRGMGYVSENGIDILHTGAMELSEQHNITIGKLAASAPALVKALQNAMLWTDEEHDVCQWRAEARAALTLSGVEG